MTKIKVSQLIWDRWNTEHIKKHNVTKAEVEKAVANAKTHMLVKQGRILLIGRVGKRILSVILNQEEKHSYYVVTARDAAKKERGQLYGKEEK
jgi:uncharacterized DUF497 family protein